MTKLHRKYRILQAAIFLLKSGLLLDVMMIKTYILQLSMFELSIFIIRIYRLLVQTRFLFDQLPLFNPYYWPLCIVHDLTNSYVEYWEELFPRCKLFGITLDVSLILCLDFLSVLHRILTSRAKKVLHKLALKNSALGTKYRRIMEHLKNFLLTK